MLSLVNILQKTNKRESIKYVSLFIFNNNIKCLKTKLNSNGKI